MQQIKEHTNGRYFNFYQHYGSGRTQDLEELAKYNIDLVPHGTVAAEFACQDGSRNALATVNWIRIVPDEARRAHRSRMHAVP